MKHTKYLLLICFSFVAAAASAQMVKDNSIWKFEAKKMAPGKYDLIAHLALERGWHVYSINPGGDGSLPSPEVKFDNNAKVKFTGKVKEHGKMITKDMEAIEGKVNMYYDKVDYIQQAVVDGKTTVTGSYTYQVCTDKLCLPPVTKKFSLSVNE